MAKISAVVLPAKASKDGSLKVRVSIAHNGTTRYIPTSITVDSPSEFKNGAVVKRPDASYLNTKLRKTLQHYQDILDEIGYADCFTCPELVQLIRNAETQKNRTLLSVYEEYISLTKIKASTKGTYQTVWNAIKAHFKGEILLEQLTPSAIKAFDMSLRKKGLSESSVRFYMQVFKTIINYAIKCGYVAYRINPFATYRAPAVNIRESWLTTEQIRQIRDFKGGRKIEMWRDIFMLSYYLGGINLADIRHLSLDGKSRTLVYIRQKVESRGGKIGRVEFRIPDEAWAILQKYGGKNGEVDISGINALKKSHEMVRYYMNKISKILGIPNLVFYSARKSFSQHATELGIQNPVIEYLLGHSPIKSGSCSHHYHFVTPKMASEALRLVLDNLK